MRTVRSLTVFCCIQVPMSGGGVRGEYPPPRVMCGDGNEYSPPWGPLSGGVSTHPAGHTRRTWYQRYPPPCWKGLGTRDTHPPTPGGQNDLRTPVKNINLLQLRWRTVKFTILFGVGLEFPILPKSDMWKRGMLTESKGLMLSAFYIDTLDWTCLGAVNVMFLKNTFSVCLVCLQSDFGEFLWRLNQT